jgi:hypothetical protein
MLENKMFVVVLVIVIIFGGLITQLFFLDRKVRKLEKKADEMNANSSKENSK